MTWLSWKQIPMLDLSFAFTATIEVDTKRALSLASGHEPYLYGLPCTRFAPLDAQTKQRLIVNTPNVTWQTFFQGALDIKKGDLLVKDNIEYPVLYVEAWPWLDNSTRLMVVIEDLGN